MRPFVNHGSACSRVESCLVRAARLGRPSPPAAKLQRLKNSGGLHLSSGAATLIRINIQPRAGLRAGSDLICASPERLAHLPSRRRWGWLEFRAYSALRLPPALWAGFILEIQGRPGWLAPGSFSRLRTQGDCTAVKNDQRTADIARGSPRDWILGLWAAYFP